MPASWRALTFAPVKPFHLTVRMENTPAPATVTEQPLIYTYFMLVKTTPVWLQLQPQDRFHFLETVIKPILKSHSQVQLRFFDSEAFTGRVSDVLLWETPAVSEYQALVEELRETLFWGTYFEIVEIIPALENAYASHYQVTPVTA